MPTRFSLVKSSATMAWGPFPTGMGVCTLKEPSPIPVPSKTVTVLSSQLVTARLRGLLELPNLQTAMPEGEDPTLRGSCITEKVPSPLPIMGMTWQPAMARSRKPGVAKVASYDA